MKSKQLQLLLFLLFTPMGQAVLPAQTVESLSTIQPEILNLDTLLQNFEIVTRPIPEKRVTSNSKRNRAQRYKIDNNAFDSLATALKVEEEKQNPKQIEVPTIFQPIAIDSLVLQSNPFFIHLVFQGYGSNFEWRLKNDLNSLYYQEKNNRSILNHAILIKKESPEETLLSLRQVARNEISRTATHLYSYIYTDLPDPEVNKGRYIEGKPLRRVSFIDDTPLLSSDQKLKIREDKANPWTKKARGLVQFSQNHSSANWYQGGNSNVAVLGSLTGKINYDDRKYIQWDNDAEWRMGFNTVPKPSLRPLNTNDDILRATSKLGIKAGGNFFYSASVDFSTQLFNNYKSTSSTELKSTFLTPVRLNIGLGLDYKVDKTLSLMVSPFSYKYIYMNDVKNVNPNLFGIEDGKNVLSEVGSAFKLLYTYVPMERVLIDTRLTFYTNYTKVEIDWETVCTLTINRFLSTRISLNPRYDNTIIGEKQGIQFKQLMSVGLAYRFVN